MKKGEGGGGGIEAKGEQRILLLVKHNKTRMEAQQQRC